MGFGDTFSKEVTVQLDDEAKSERKDRLVTVDQKIHSVVADKASSLGDYNGQLKALRDEQKKLLTAIETGVETVSVQVLERVDERRGEVHTVRVDTNEIIPELTRPLTGEERQLTLDDAGSRKRGKGKRARGSAAADAED